MMKKRLFILMFLILLIMGGCKNEKQLPGEEIAFDFSTQFSLCKDGILYCSDLLYITDYATGVTVPLCDKPNCAHEPQSSTNENPQCNAAYPGMFETAFLYHDKLYVFVRDGLNHTTVYMAENTGEGRRKIAETDYTWYGNREFRDGKLYFAAERESYEEGSSLRQEKEVFIGSFDTDSRSFEILTTPDTSLWGINIAGITSQEIFYVQYKFLDDERKNWTNVSVEDISVEYIAKNLETGEERNFFEGEDIVDHLGDYCVVETGIYYMLNKDGTYEYWKKETDGNEMFIYSADHLALFRPIINGEPLFEKDKSAFQKELNGLCTCGDMIFVTDRRKGSRHGIITVDNYLNNIDEVVYPVFPNMTYFSSDEQTSQEVPSGKVDGIHLEFDPAEKTMLTWMAPYGVANSDDDVYIEFNNLLDRKGYDFYVSFYTPGNMLEEYTQLIYDAAASGQEIDIFCTGYDFYANLYSDLARDGLCQELNGYLETTDGKALYDARDELVWKSTSVEGKIYGLTGMPVMSRQTGLHYYVNQDIAKKYGIDCERLFQDTSYFYDSIFAVEEGEKSDENFEPYLSGDLFNLPEDMMQVRGPVALRVDSDGKYQAVNIYEDDRIRKAIIACHELCKRGHKVHEYTQSQIDAGNYFVIVSYEPLECSNAMEFTRSPLIENGNKTGGITCIANWSKNKEAAFELLCAVHTDRELSEMLAFGIEGIHYRVEGEEIIKSGVDYAGRFAASLLANTQLLRGSYYNNSAYSSLSEEEKETLLTNPLFGNPLDCRKIKKQLVELWDCEGPSFPNNADSWVGQDFDQKYDDGLQKFRDAGIDEVLNEINQQLKDRGLQ